MSDKCEVGAPRIVILVGDDIIGGRWGASPGSVVTIAEELSAGMIVVGGAEMGKEVISALVSAGREPKDMLLVTGVGAELSFARDIAMKFPSIPMLIISFVIGGDSEGSQNITRLAHELGCAMSDAEAIWPNHETVVEWVGVAQKRAEERVVRMVAYRASFKDSVGKVLGLR